MKKWSKEVYLRGGLQAAVCFCVAEVMLQTSFHHVLTGKFLPLNEGDTSKSKVVNWTEDGKKKK